jgi:hypothetical protein
LDRVPARRIVERSRQLQCATARADRQYRLDRALPK